MASMTMEGISRLIVDEYQDIMQNKSDPRSQDWPLMSTPWPTLALSLVYVLVSVWLGPKLMKSRKPYDLRRVIVIYNGLQVLYSAWLFYEFGQSGWFGRYSFTCQPVDYTQNPMALRMLNVSWWYFISKFTEFLDTFFFILRGKMNHVSNLHVIHHGVMPFNVWLGVKFAPGGNSTFMGVCNTFVHVLMYFYYMVSAMGPKYGKYIWWKKYLTNIQITQFIIVFIHTIQLLFRDCDYPKTFVYLISSYSILFLVLFLNFHIKTYRRRSSVASVAAAAAAALAKGQSSSSSTNGKKMSNGFKSKAE